MKTFKEYKMQVNERADISKMEHNLAFMGKDGLEPTVELIKGNTFKITNSEKWGGMAALKDAFTNKSSKFVKALKSVTVEDDHIVVEFSKDLMTYLNK